MKNIIILGASGFVGRELINMCINHPDISIVGLSANDSIGEKIDFNSLNQNDSSHLNYERISEIDFSNADFVFNCLPNECLHNLVKQFPENIRIIDLSSDFRLKNDQDYLSWYKFEHQSTNIIKDFHYGLTEFNRESIKKSRHIANPGCYATSVLMPLTALMQKELIKSKNIIVDAKSGYSGAGKVKNADQLLEEVNENIKSYGVGDHKHIAEINQELTDINEGTDVNIFFSANLIPVKRGILSNIYIQPNNSSSEEIYDALVEKFENERFVSVLPINEIPVTKDVVGTNNLIIGVKKGYMDDIICIVSSLDNLLKGAAGQAIQNFNIMNNIDEGTSLI